MSREFPSARLNVKVSLFCLYVLVLALGVSVAPYQYKKIPGKRSEYGLFITVQCMKMLGWQGLCYI